MIDYQEHLRRDVDSVLAVLAGTTLTEPVPACPGWRLRDLVLHLGSVHRWATSVLRTGTAQREAEHTVQDLRSWFADGATELLTTLAVVDPLAPCWSFTTDKTTGFWLRRQALETVVHRWDAQRAVGAAGHIDPALAADGIAEVVDLLAPRQLKHGHLTPWPGTVALRATDTGDSWTLGAGPAVGSVEGPAATLLLLLWHRIEPGEPSLRSDRAAEQVLRGALVP